MLDKLAIFRWVMHWCYIDYPFFSGSSEAPFEFMSTHFLSKLFIEYVILVGGRLFFFLLSHGSMANSQHIFIFIGQFISMAKIRREYCIDYLVNYVEEKKNGYDKC